MEKGGSVYIMTNRNNTTLYTGVTSDLIDRVYKHRTGFYPNSFTSRYNLTKLVFYRNFHSIEEAIAFEKRLKRGTRQNKINLIVSMNPDWVDLYDKVMEEW